MHDRKILSNQCCVRYVYLEVRLVESSGAGILRSLYTMLRSVLLYLSALCSRKPLFTAAGFLCVRFRWEWICKLHKLLPHRTYLKGSSKLNFGCWNGTLMNEEDWNQLHSHRRLARPPGPRPLFWNIRKMRFWLLLRSTSRQGKDATLICKVI